MNIYKTVYRNERTKEYNEVYISAKSIEEARLTLLKEEKDAFITNMSSFKGIDICDQSTGNSIKEINGCRVITSQ